MATLRTRLTNVWIAVATAVGLVAVTLPLFLNPIWVGFEQGRAQAAAWTGYPPVDLRAATDAILGDLVVGPPDFDVEIGGSPVLNERERGHMRDVRTVFAGFFAATVALGMIANVVALRRRGEHRQDTWRAVRIGAVGLIVVVVVGGVVAIVAFDTLFEVFHRLLFSGGSYSFDPRTERLVQLFPFQFWQETAIAVGAIAAGLAAIVAIIATGRLGSDDVAVGATRTTQRSVAPGSSE